MKIRSYSELVSFKTFKERFEYLRLRGVVGQSTFGFDRYLNQTLYKSYYWKKVRQEVIIRDNGCDLGIEDFVIFDKIMIHHMNPITIEQVEKGDPSIFNPEFLICVSVRTHNAIHFGDETLLPKDPIVRFKNDTCPWKKD